MRPVDAPIDRLDLARHRLDGRAALLVKLAQAEAQHRPGGIDHDLDRAFWQGVGALVEDMRADLAVIATASKEIHGGAR